jgi:hypothetical protein
MFSPSVKSVNPKNSRVSEASKPRQTSQVSEYYSPLVFFPTNFNHAFMPKPDFEVYRQEAKKQYEGDQGQYESSPNLLSEDLHQMPDTASTFD